MIKSIKKIVGIIPAGGLATRISPLPCSKEIYPIGFIKDLKGNVKSPKVACHYLLDKMKLAGAKNIFIILGKNKWDIPNYLGTGQQYDVNIAYLLQGVPYGVPFTIDQAYPFVKDSLVLFGFPDVLFEPNEAFQLLLSELEKSDSDIILGVFPAAKPEKIDMVEIDDKSQIRDIIIKPKKTSLKYSWSIAIWTPIFSDFLHNYLENVIINYPIEIELQLGEVIKLAISKGMKVHGHIISNKPILDVGTGDDLLLAVKKSVTKTQ
jgi:glucose-1-phosphate thymidylyltransferase